MPCYIAVANKFYLRYHLKYSITITENGQLYNNLYSLAYIKALVSMLLQRLHFTSRGQDESCPFLHAS